MTTVATVYSQLEFGNVKCIIRGSIPDVSITKGGEELAFQRKGIFFSNSNKINVPVDSVELEKLIVMSKAEAIKSPQRLQPIQYILLSTFLLKNEKKDEFLELYASTYQHAPHFFREYNDQMLANSIRMAQSRLAVEPICILANSNNSGYWLLYKSYNDKGISIVPQFFLNTPLGIFPSAAMLNDDPEIAALWNALVYQQIKMTQNVEFKVE